MMGSRQALSTDRKLGQQEMGISEVPRWCLVLGVRHSGDVVRHEADEQHRQDAEDATVGLVADATIVPAHFSV